MNQLEDYNLDDHLLKNFEHCSKEVKGKISEKQRARAVEFQVYLETLKTIALETASQKVLRNCSQEVRGEVNMYKHNTAQQRLVTSVANDSILVEAGGE